MVVKITNKPEHDPVSNMVLLDAYLRWALLAAEEIIGKEGVDEVLMHAGLRRMIGSYPAELLVPSGQYTFGDYANFNASLIALTGVAGKAIAMRVGRLSAYRAIKQQGGTFNVETITAARSMDVATQIRMGLSAVMAGFFVLNRDAKQEFIGSVEDVGESYHFILETCPVCAGKHATAPMCWLIEGTIEEGGRELFGKFVDVVQTKSRATGDPFCLWEVPKVATRDPYPAI